MNTVELARIRKTYDDVIAVNDVSLSIHSGQIYGLLGPNGAGKTSILRMMIGILIPDSGQVSMFGSPLSRAHMNRIGYLPEERGLYRRMKVADHLVLLAELKGMSHKDAVRRVHDWCDRLGLASWTGKRVGELSKGMQQKVQFISALVHEPDFIAMDEPFSGLDPANTGVLKDVLLELKKLGKTVLLSTHRMDLAERLCDAICLINHGCVVLQGEVMQVRARYGSRNVQIKYDGDSGFLRDPSLAESFSDYGNYAEIHMALAADTQELLRRAAAQARINRFEVVEPSLEEIFIDVVGGHRA